MVMKKPNTGMPDPLTNADQSWRSWAATKEYDIAAGDIERTWGSLDGLLKHASEKQRELFAELMHEVDNAILFANHAQTKSFANRAATGLRQIEKAVRQAGIEPVQAIVWIEGSVGIVKTTEELVIHAEQAKAKGIRLYTLAEAVRLIEAKLDDNTQTLVEHIKDEFPGAEVVSVKSNLDDIDDDVPWERSFKIERIEKDIWSW